MKKVFFTLAVLVCFCAVNAQEYKMWVGGNIGIDHINSDYDDYKRITTSWDAIGEVGFFLNEDVGFGVKAGYEYSKIERDSDSGARLQDKGHGIIINPFVRYMFIKGDVGTFFFDTGVDFRFGKDNGDTFNQIAVGIRPGVLVNVGNGFALKATVGHLGYRYRELKSEPKVKISSYGFRANFEDVSLGMIYCF